MDMPKILVVEDDYRWIQSFQPQNFGYATIKTDFASGLYEIANAEAEYDYGIFDKVLALGNMKLEDMELPDGINASGMLLAWAFQSRFPIGKVAITTGGPFSDEVPPMISDLVKTGFCLYINKNDKDADIRIGSFLKGEPLKIGRKTLDYITWESPTLFGIKVDMKKLIERLFKMT